MRKPKIPLGRRRRWMTMLLIAAVCLSLWNALRSTRQWLEEAESRFLTETAQEALLSVLAQYTDSDLVQLRRDYCGSITAISVNGVLLNQLKSQYLQALTAGVQHWRTKLPLSDFLGIPVLFWLPWRIPLDLTPQVRWQVTILSRTVRTEEGELRYQLILETIGRENGRIPLRSTEVRQETLLFETVLRTAGDFSKIP